MRDRTGDTPRWPETRVAAAIQGVKIGSVALLQAEVTAASVHAGQGSLLIPLWMLQAKLYQQKACSLHGGWAPLSVQYHT